MRLDDLAALLRRSLRRGDMRVVDACALAILRRGDSPWRRAAVFQWLADAARLRRSLALSRRLQVNADMDAVLLDGHRRALRQSDWLAQGEPSLP